MTLSVSKKRRKKQQQPHFQPKLHFFNIPIFSQKTEKFDREASQLIFSHREFWSRRKKTKFLTWEHLGSAKFDFFVDREQHLLVFFSSSFLTYGFKFVLVTVAEAACHCHCLCHWQRQRHVVGRRPAGTGYTTESGSANFRNEIVQRLLQPNSFIC